MPIRTEVTTIRAGASLDPGGLKRYRYFEAILDVASNSTRPTNSLY
jgi:hypothetical protein